MGHIPDGVFDFIGNTLEILSAPKRTFAELSRLAGIIETACETKASPVAVSEQIEQEFPELAGLARLLPKTRSELYSFLAILLTIITLITQSGTESKAPGVTVNHVINQTILQCPAPASSSTGLPRTTSKIGRNDPCPCGSGRKFKKCCGVTP